MSAPNLPIILSNPLRVISPLATAALCVVMFVPPLLLADWTEGDRLKLGSGVTLLALGVAWLCRSAWRAPYALRVEGDSLVVRRLTREQRYDVARVRKWWFAIPDGPPTRVPPPTNGVLYVTFDDRARFRGEVTSEEAARLAAILPVGR